MQCQQCSTELLDQSLFCDACGLSRASLVPDENVLRSYCGKCGSRLQGSKKCYCVQCGEETIYLTGPARASLWEQILNNPKLQFAIAGVCLALLIVPIWALMPEKKEESLDAQVRAQTIRAQTGKTAPEAFHARQLNVHSGEFAGLQLKQLSGVVRDVDGSMYLTDRILNMVYKIGADGKQKVIAGTGEAGFSGDRGDATEAQLSGPRGITMDAAGNLYIADTGNHVVRLIDRSGEIRTIAGMAPSEKIKPGRSLDPARQIELLSPISLSIGLKNEIYVTEDPHTGGSRDPSVWILEPQGGSSRPRR